MRTLREQQLSPQLRAAETKKIKKEQNENRTLKASLTKKRKREHDDEQKGEVRKEKKKITYLPVRSLNLWLG